MGIAAALLLALLLVQMRRAGDTGLAGSQPGSLTHRLEELDAQFAASPDPAELRARLKREAAEVEAEHALAAAIVPEVVDPASIGPTLDDLARAAGVEVDEFTAGQPQATGGGLEALPLTLRLRGNYDKVAGFVSAVEGLDDPAGDAPRHIEVEGITAAPQSDDAEPEWTLALRTYAFRGGEPDGHGDVAEDNNASLQDLASARRYEYEPLEQDIMTPPAAPVAVAPKESPAAPATRIPEITTQPRELETALESGLAEMAAAVSAGRHDDAIAAADAALLAAGAAASPREQELLDRMRQHRDELVRRHGSVADAAAFADLGVRVEGISWSPAEPRAVVNGGILAVGDAVDGHPEVRVAAIDKTTVTFDYGGGRHIVGVKMFARP